jgi:glycolate oxidase FAD binding subunit
VGSAVDEMLDRLGPSGVAIRAAEESDAIDGVLPSAVVAPADTDGVAAVLRIAAERGCAVSARGTGTKLDWGLPPARLDVLIDTSELNRIVDHAAGDLVVQVQAGLRLDVLQRALAGSRQRLALDPLTNPGADGLGTVGGMVATAADGPLRFAYGATRDLIIGITVVRADGVVARAGGKVVKNVAGYDLGKLMTGSWGTLGVITEAIFRLHPLPEEARWIVHATPDAPQAARAAANSQAVPAAVEIDHPPGGGTTVAVLVEGVSAGVDARARTITEIIGGGSVRDAAPAWWGRAPWTAGGTALLLTSTLTGVERVLATFAELPLPAAVRGSAGVGKLYAGFAPDADVGVLTSCVRKLRERAPQWGGDVVVLRAPAEVRAALDSWGPVSGLSLMRRVKHEFDPDGRLSPGRFVGGI